MSLEDPVTFPFPSAEDKGRSVLLVLKDTVRLEPIAELAGSDKIPAAIIGRVAEWHEVIPNGYQVAHYPFDLNGRTEVIPAV